MAAPYRQGRIAQGRKAAILTNELATLDEGSMQLVIMDAMLARFDPLKSAVLLRGMAHDLEGMK